MHKQIKAHPRITILIFFLIALALTILIGGYRLNWAWTGFTGEKETYRTLYDWLQLLFIPVVLAIAGFWFNHRERKAAELRAENEQKTANMRALEELKFQELHAQTEHEVSQDNQRESALQTYIKDMSELLLNNNLRNSKKDDEVRSIARVRTLTALRRLDPDRKSSVVLFLKESGLIEKHNLIVDLMDADLKEVKLSFTNLGNADLSGTDLSGAELYYAYLKDSNLIGTDLSRAWLENANLTKSDLTAANLKDAYLDLANLSEAIFTYEQLDAAKSLDRTIMQDGSLYKKPPVF